MLTKVHKSTSRKYELELRIEQMEIDMNTLMIKKEEEENNYKGYIAMIIAMLFILIWTIILTITDYLQ